MSKSQRYNPAKSSAMKQYLKLMATAANGAVNQSVEIRRKTGKLDALTKQEIKEEVRQYEDVFENIHNLVLKQAKKQAKRMLGDMDMGTDDEEDHSSSSRPQKKTKRKRPRTDISKFISFKVPKRASAEDDILEAVEKVVEYLNEKYGSNGLTFKALDSNKSTAIKIVVENNGKELTHSLIGKYEFDRKREQKPRDQPGGDIVDVKTEEQDGYTVHNCYNEDNELVTSFKCETVKKGDVLRANPKGGSAIPVPAIRGNILDDMEDVLARLSKQGIQNVPVKPVEDDDAEAEDEAEPEDEEQEDGNTDAEDGDSGSDGDDDE
jgi:hypothetical protein